MTVLADHNLEGQAVLLWGTLLPVITVARVDRLDERSYRERCSSRLIEIMLDIENYAGVGRIFIP